MLRPFYNSAHAPSPTISSLFILYTLLYTHSNPLHNMIFVQSTPSVTNHPIIIHRLIIHWSIIQFIPSSFSSNAPSSLLLLLSTRYRWKFNYWRIFVVVVGKNYNEGQLERVGIEMNNNNRRMHACVSLSSQNTTRTPHNTIQSHTSTHAPNTTTIHRADKKTHLVGSWSCFLAIFLRALPSSVLVVSGTLCFSALKFFWCVYRNILVKNIRVCRHREVRYGS